MHNKDLSHAPLGKLSANISQYQPDLLFPVAREQNRAAIHIHTTLPFQGHDIWNAYELSWLNAKGKPIVAAAKFILPCQSPFLIESKSFKLYLNSLNNTHFDSMEAVASILTRDLSAAAGAPVQVKLFPLAQGSEKIVRAFSGTHLDELDIECDIYQPEPTFLTTEEDEITETVYSDLLKSNCLITGQPDWGSVQITYTGKKIQHAGLLKYIVSFRNHDEFHEHCVERIFVDITKQCQPEKLLVYARYTRRGGLDINPYRANYAVDEISNLRLYRQ